MKPRRALLLGALAFSLALIAVLPVRWVAGALPPHIHCAAWSGSIWRGHCQDLRVSPGTRTAMRLAEVSWKVRPTALLRLALAVEFQGRWPDGQATGFLEARSGSRLSVRDTALQSVIDRRLVGALPQGWNGRADIRQLEIDYDNGRVDRLGGEIRITGLVDGRGNALGGYTLVMPSSTTPPFTGALRDAGDGPLEVDAQLQLGADRSWSLDGRMRARDAGNMRLARQLDLFASPDAAGWRRLSAAGSFN